MKKIIGFVFVAIVIALMTIFAKTMTEINEEEERIEKLHNNIVENIKVETIKVETIKVEGLD